MLRCLLWALAAAVRPKAALIADNLCLRQQLLVLQRRKPRPRLDDADRRFLILERFLLDTSRNRHRGFHRAPSSTQIRFRLLRQQRRRNAMARGTRTSCVRARLHWSRRVRAGARSRACSTSRLRPQCVGSTYGRRQAALKINPALATPGRRSRRTKIGCSISLPRSRI